MRHDQWVPSNRNRHQTPDDLRTEDEITTWDSFPTRITRSRSRGPMEGTQSNISKSYRNRMEGCGVIQGIDHHFARRSQQNVSSKGTTSDFIQAGLALEANRQRTYCKSAMVRAWVQGPRHPRVRAKLRHFSSGVHQHHDADPCLVPVRRNLAHGEKAFTQGDPSVRRDPMYAEPPPEGLPDVPERSLIQSGSWYMRPREWDVWLEIDTK